MASIMFFSKTQSGNTDGWESAEHSFTLSELQQGSAGEDGERRRLQKNKNDRNSRNYLPLCLLTFKNLHERVYVFDDLSKIQRYGVIWAVLPPSSI